ncbi:unnamed protein product [Ceutorhynchus assimilis]|uniref:C2H2-type domain-containing protein n=1 Tax=Ceutorhynchus assimilis TaxID=467358 RepID=A0A9N9QJW9_9CUCU|nr:unnamed protein product [Ceutorhynchus assimilis]
MYMNNFVEITILPQQPIINILSTPIVKLEGKLEHFLLQSIKEEKCKVQKKPTVRKKGSFTCNKCNRIYIPQDLRLPKPLPQWPPNLVLPMMLLRENLQQSVFQNVQQNPNNYFDLAKLPKPKGLKIPVDNSGSHVCPDCGRIYKLRSSLRNHQKWECGKEPQFKCPFCSYKAKQKMHMLRHTERMHKGMDLTAIKKEMGGDDEASQNYETSNIEGVKDLSLKRSVKVMGDAEEQDNASK